MDQKRDNIEVRLHDDGTLDEIVIYDPHTNQCLFHLEQMDDHYYWMRAYGITQDLVVYIGTTVGKCNGVPITDERGFITGFNQIEGPKVSADFEWDEAFAALAAASECVKNSAMPDVEKRLEIATIINKYGVACVLEEITDILRGGRMAEHEQAVVADLDNVRTKFLAGAKAFWDAKFSEKYEDGT